MKYTFVILLILAFCAIKTVPPPPIPEPVYQDFSDQPKVQKPNLRAYYMYFESEGDEPAKFYANETKARINYVKDGLSAEYHLNITTKNLQKNHYYGSYTINIYVPEGKSIQMIENECKQLIYSE